MSALWAPITGWLDDSRGTSEQARLRAVPAPAARMARFPYLLVLMGLFGVGMAGLLMVNTTLQNQAFESRRLDRQATELAYAQADLENKLDTLAAPMQLARRASALGMRPNPYPAFLVLPEGTVIGTPKRVGGGEIPGLIVKTPAQIEAERATARAIKEAKAAERAAQAKAAAAEKKRKAAEAAAKAEAAKKAAEKKAAEQKAADKKAADKVKANGSSGTTPTGQG